VKKKFQQKTIFEKKSFKKNRSQLGLVLQIHNSSHEIGVTPLKANPKNQRSKFLNQTNMRDKMEKKINKKIAIKRIKTKFNIKMK
jgi:hypothetical protein